MMLQLVLQHAHPQLCKSVVYVNHVAINVKNVCLKMFALLVQMIIIFIREYAKHLALLGLIHIIQPVKTALNNFAFLVLTHKAHNTAKHAIFPKKHIFTMAVVF